MKITEISKGSSVDSETALQSLAVSEFVSQFPLAPYIEFYSINGNADTPRKVSAGITAGDTRIIGTDYTAKSDTPGFGAVALKIYGDKVKTDIAYQRRGTDIGSQRALDLANFSRSMGRYFMDSVINDALSVEKFSGIKEQIDALSRKEVYLTVNGGSVPTGNGNTEVKAQQAFREWLDAQINDIMGGPQILGMNGAMIARLESMGSNYVTFSNVQDIYGANQVVRSYKGIPIVNFGFKADGSGLVIPSTETEGTAVGTCTSIYLLRFGEMQDVTFATNVGLDVKDLGLIGTEYVTMVELDVDLAILNAKSVKRLSGIIL
jgi:hypothetical protein